MLTLFVLIFAFVFFTALIFFISLPVTLNSDIQSEINYERQRREQAGYRRTGDDYTEYPAAKCGAGRVRVIGGDK